MFPDVSKVLVFVNSRKQVDTASGDFSYGRFDGFATYGHHGSLSKEEREDVESRFRSDARAICIATMTLEIGIDIGDVDLVICIDPPFSIPSFLRGSVVDAAAWRGEPESCALQGIGRAN